MLNTTNRRVVEQRLAALGFRHRPPVSTPPQMAKQKADFALLNGRIAAVTGGGSGMGRELCIQLAAAGCHTSFCDLSPVEMDETKALCEATAPPGTRVSCHVADVSSEEDILAFRDAVMEVHSTDALHYVFNNAGIAGGNSFLDESAEGRAKWEQTFNVDWYGVYYASRAFIPMLKRADEGALVNTSSINGFWASLGPGSQHSAYVAAKFAVKGFTEALVVEFATHAPHIHAAVVMPGHVGTSIALKSAAEVDPETGEWKQKELSAAEKQGMIARMGMEAAIKGKSDDEVDAIIAKVREAMGEGFKNAGLSAADAAGLIIRGTLEKRWRILLGDDAHRLDQAIRASPEDAYDADVESLFQNQDVEGWSKEGSLRVETVDAEAVTAEPAAGVSAKARL